MGGYGSWVRFLYRGILRSTLKPVLALQRSPSDWIGVAKKNMKDQFRADRNDALQIEPGFALG
jgi:hypothetical protein